MTKQLNQVPVLRQLLTPKTQSKKKGASAPLILYQYYCPVFGNGVPVANTLTGM